MRSARCFALEEWLLEVLNDDEEVPRALATIVSAVGSTPREAGARMVIYRDGRFAGTVGGGCGEAEVRQAALDVMDTGVPKMIDVDLRGFYGDDMEVCGGRMRVFIEPLARRRRETGRREAG